MVKLNRDAVIVEALDLLDEVGLDGVSTRALARRLGVEQPSLYWHVRSKEDLLVAMAEAAMSPHAAEPLTMPSQDWRAWFVDNMRSFRQTLLARRDGARLHAGSRPGTGDRERIVQKIAFLTAAGIPQHDAEMAMLAAGRFTVGSVLEEQADQALADAKRGDVEPELDHQAAFEEGLRLVVDGLAARRRT